MKTTADIATMHPNKLISWFMIASYAYYHLDSSVMSDYDFDYLVKRILENWEDIDHPHKDLIKKTNTPPHIAEFMMRDIGRTPFGQAVYRRYTSDNYTGRNYKY